MPQRSNIRQSQPMHTMPRPLRRSRLRLWLGTRYYRIRRRIAWMLSGTRWARSRQPDLLPHPIAHHQTPLLRQLKDVDIWLQHNKIVNLRLALQQINHILLQPGETFSYWRTIGHPTRRKGYVEGMVLVSGGFRPGIGGGLCQLSNLLYWITLHSPLQVTERHRHSYDVFPDANRTQPFGSGATCAYNYLDLCIYNPTTEPYQLHVWMDETDLHGEWRSNLPGRYRYEVYEKEHRMTQQLWGGYTRHNIIARRTFNADGEVVSDEIVTANDARMMYQPFLPEGETE